MMNMSYKQISKLMIYYTEKSQVSLQPIQKKDLKNKYISTTLILKKKTLGPDLP